MKINTEPTVCNICSGRVIYTSNKILYGKQYGSGYCYYCTNCRAYVGTHKPRPKEAMGILANNEMREWKHKCHNIFDPIWQGHIVKRYYLYRELAVALCLPVEECHFGYFDVDTLSKAYDIMLTWEPELLRNKYHGRKQTK